MFSIVLCIIANAQLHDRVKGQVMAPQSSVVAAWDLGLRLKEKRESLCLRGKDVEAKTGIATSYLSVVEKGKQHLSAEKLRAVAEVLEFDEADIAELIALREQAVVLGWWTKYSALFKGEVLRLFGFEHGAESIRTYDGGLVYGLLQTEGYARAIIEAGAPNIRLAEVDRRTQARMIRQRRLTAPEPLQLLCVMSEAALRQQVGGPDVLAEQLRHLADLIEKCPDTIEIRIVPFEATGHHAMGGSTFHILAFPSGHLPTLVWQETVTSTQLIDNLQTVGEYSRAHTAASGIALDREASLELIIRLAKEIE